MVLHSFSGARSGTAPGRYIGSPLIIPAVAGTPLMPLRGEGHAFTSRLGAEAWPTTLACSRLGAVVWVGSPPTFLLGGHVTTPASVLANVNVTSSAVLVTPPGMCIAPDRKCVALGAQDSRQRPFLCPLPEWATAREHSLRGQPREGATVRDAHSAVGLASALATIGDTRGGGRAAATGVVLRQFVDLVTSSRTTAAGTCPPSISDARAGPLRCGVSFFFQSLTPMVVDAEGPTGTCVSQDSLGDSPLRMCIPLVFSGRAYGHPCLMASTWLVDPVDVEAVHKFLVPSEVAPPSETGVSAPDHDPAPTTNPLLALAAALAVDGCAEVTSSLLETECPGAVEWVQRLAASALEHIQERCAGGGPLRLGDIPGVWTLPADAICKSLALLLAKTQGCMHQLVTGALDGRPHVTYAAGSPFNVGYRDVVPDAPLAIDTLLRSVPCALLSTGIAYTGVRAGVGPPAYHDDHHHHQTMLASGSAKSSKPAASVRALDGDRPTADTDADADAPAMGTSGHGQEKEARSIDWEGIEGSSAHHVPAATIPLIPCAWADVHTRLCALDTEEVTSRLFQSLWLRKPAAPAAPLTKVKAQSEPCHQATPLCAPSKGSPCEPGLATKMAASPKKRTLDGNRPAGGGLRHVRRRSDLKLDTSISLGDLL